MTSAFTDFMWMAETDLKQFDEEVTQEFLFEDEVEEHQLQPMLPSLNAEAPEFVPQTTTTTKKST
eukprot:m.111018 g.111018  ORF g.111018 m.111018 type:complete len:65 (-) comp22751_c0_seq1:76-270(-)